jgi:hypothetical protein
MKTAAYRLTVKDLKCTETDAITGMTMNMKIMEANARMAKGTLDGNVWSYSSALRYSSRPLQPVSSDMTMPLMRDMITRLMQDMFTKHTSTLKHADADTIMEMHTAMSMEASIF